MQGEVSLEQSLYSIIVGYYVSGHLKVWRLKFCVLLCSLMQQNTCKMIILIVSPKSFPIKNVFTSVVTLGCTVAGANPLCAMSELCVTLLHYYVHSSMEIGLMTRPSHML